MEALCINRSEESDLCAANFMGKPAPSAEDKSINSYFALIAHQALKASSLAAANANGPKKLTKTLAASSGCSGYEALTGSFRTLPET